jgi:biotin synthase
MMQKITDKLLAGQRLTQGEFARLISERTPEQAALLRKEAERVRQEYYGKDVYVRGLIEFSNFCKNDCLYCGIRRSNATAQRYRLTEEEILSCCENGYGLGFRTFVLQSGEDGYFTPAKLEGLVREIKSRYPDCAVTLSVGEYPREVYQRWYDAGADRYLLRHETADKAHYQKLHPAEMSFDNRMRCLRDLKDIGYQVGCGMMVGSPDQTPDTLGADLYFIQEFQPHMVGIGPFIPAHDTPFAKETAGTLELTLYLLSVIRLTLPQVLLPATTALGTIHPLGREKGIQAGANVCMPNLSPVGVRAKYSLYDNKICTGDEAAECRFCLENRMKSIGYQVVVSRGDHIGNQHRKDEEPCTM